jgi:hypothetical protein
MPNPPVYEGLPKYCIIPPHSRSFFPLPTVDEENHGYDERRRPSIGNRDNYPKRQKTNESGLYGGYRENGEGECWSGDSGGQADYPTTAVLIGGNFFRIVAGDTGPLYIPFE